MGESTNDVGNSLFLQMVMLLIKYTREPTANGWTLKKNRFKQYHHLRSVMASVQIASGLGDF